MERETLVYTQLKHKHDSKNHCEVHHVEQVLNDWLHVYSRASGINESLVSHKLSYVATRLYHYAPCERVLAISKLLAFLFLLDDKFEVMDAEWIRNQSERLIEIARNDEIIPLQGENWPQACWSDLWQNFSKLGEHEWKHRLIHSFSMWFKGCEMEVKFRQPKKVPSLVEYLTLRPVSEGEFIFNFIEFASDKYLSPETLSNPVFNSLLHYSRRVMFATNDFHSFEKETRKGDVMNMVMVFRDEHKISIQDALHKTIEFINENLEMFESLEHQLVSSLIDDDIEFYVTGLHAMFKGFHDFHCDSERYKIRY